MNCDVLRELGGHQLVLQFGFWGGGMKKSFQFLVVLGENPKNDRRGWSSGSKSWARSAIHKKKCSHPLYRYNVFIYTKFVCNCLHMHLKLFFRWNVKFGDTLDFNTFQQLFGSGNTTGTQQHSHAYSTHVSCIFSLKIWFISVIWSYNPENLIFLCESSSFASK